MHDRVIGIDKGLVEEQQFNLTNGSTKLITRYNTETLDMALLASISTDKLHELKNKIDNEIKLRLKTDL